MFTVYIDMPILIDKALKHFYIFFVIGKSNIM